MTKLQLKNNLIFYSLLAINFITATVSFFIAYQQDFPDAKGYISMSESFGFFKFSSWYFLSDYYPETFRTPGYPFFIFMINGVFKSINAVKIIQLLLYFISLLLGISILNKISHNNKKTISIFLVLSSLNIQIPFYSGYISAESLTIFLTILYSYIFIVKDFNYKNNILLGIISAAIFIVRPSFLLFPFGLLILHLLIFKENKKYYLINGLVYFILLIPFSFWNKINHNVFKPTTIEGGAGVAHMAYWSFKLPNGYTENFYWGNNTGYDLTNPFKLTKNEQLNNKIKFENEWNNMLLSLSKYNSKKDSLNIQYMKKNNPGFFFIYNSEYTKKREELLWKKTIEHIKEDFRFYIQTRLYTLFRLYYTGINFNDWNKSKSISEKIKILFPFIITFSFILIGGLVTIICLFKKLFSDKYISFLILLILYQGFIHVFFVIQSRYTIPVHLLILILLSFIIGQFNLKKNKTL
jgi:hypothetical protein